MEEYISSKGGVTFASIYLHASIELGKLKLALIQTVQTKTLNIEHKTD